MKTSETRAGRSGASTHLAGIVITVALWFLLAATQGPLKARADGSTGGSESCECKAAACGPCEVETGTTFYSAKCGSNLSKVKSCKRATCEAVEDQKQCLALFKEAKPTADLARSPAASETVRAGAGNASEAGEIIDLRGETKVHHANGITEQPRKREAAYVGDTFETSGDGLVKVLLRDGSEMTVASNSKITVEKVDVNVATMKRQIAMMIVAGKVRNRVQKEYKGDNYFQVKTKTAIAGVRGTDFIASFEPGAAEWVSEIRTIEGLVKLQSSKAAAEDGVPATVEVPAGTYASVVNEAPGRGQANDIDAVASRARVTPLFKIKDDDLQRFKDNPNFFGVEVAAVRAPQRSVASEAAGDDVCQEPSGRFNQCSWTCEHNPAGEKKCRTDLANVACVRRLCRANGLWVEPKRVPASEGGLCSGGSHPVVHECDGYW